MKIYHKRHFGSGLFFIVLGMLNIFACIWTGFDVSGIILIAALLLIGSGLTIRSLSSALSKEDKLEKLDERNQLIELKTKSKAFRLTQGISFGLMLLFLIAGKVTEEMPLLSIGVGLAFAYTISMFTEIFTYLYYETHN